MAGAILLLSTCWLILKIISCRNMCEISWTYHGLCGAKTWGKYYPTCAGSSQSPVNLPKKTNLYGVPISPPFAFTNFYTINNITWFLENNGHAVNVIYLSGDLKVSGGGLSSTFNVAQFHFHWGSNDWQGSEHTIGGDDFAMEMHIVAYNTLYNNFKDALMHHDGLAVLGVLFKVQYGDNPRYQKLVNSLSDIIDPGTEANLDPQPLITLMPANTRVYYRYNGSLTTPPCSETVLWTVFAQPVGLSSRQLAAFRKLRSSETAPNGDYLPLVDNFRPIQPLNGRRIQ